MIKLITCDLDGTLFDSKKNISDENRQAIQSLKETKFVVASGRPIEGVIPVNEYLGLTNIGDYTICYNGALIIENDTKQLIFEKYIDGKMVKRIFKEAIRLNTNFHAFKKDGTLITNEKNPYTAVEEKINNLEALVVNFDDIADNELFLKCMMVSNEEKLDQIRGEIDNEIADEVTINRSSKIFLEFLNKEANKGMALCFLADYLNISMDETMAIGDADNDRTMLLAASEAVAMKNSFESILAIASYITDDNEHSGVAKAISHFDCR